MLKRSSVYLILFGFLLVCCRKMDKPSFVQQQNAELANTFFRLPANSEPLMVKLVDILRADNSKKEYVSRIAKFEGMPLWDKTFVQINSKTAESGTRRVDGARSGVSGAALIPEANDTILYVPLVPTGKKFVYSFIWAKVNGSSVDWRLYSGRDYDTYENGSLESEGVNAEKLAMVTMLLDAKVFGYTSFRLSDPKLFNATNQAATYRNLKLVDPNKSPEGVTNIRPNLFLYLVYCSEVTSFHCTQSGPCITNGECDGCGDCKTWALDCFHKIVYIADGSSGSGGGTVADNPSGVTGGDGSTIDAPCAPGTPCGDLGWSAEELIAQEIANELSFNASDKAWLITHPSEATDILDVLNEYDHSEEAKDAVRIGLRVFRSGFSFTESVLDTILDLLQPPAIKPYKPVYKQYLKYQMAAEYEKDPSASRAKRFLRANAELLHMGLDFAGLIPVVGEVFDISNGLWYAIEGNWSDAKWSLMSAVPIIGTVPATAKIIKNGRRIVMRWMAEAGQWSYPKNYRALRKALGLVPGDGLIAHHIIPLSSQTHPMLQKAAWAGFDMNVAGNGIALSSAVHTGGHASYITKLETKMTEVYNLNPNMSTQDAKNALESIINQVRNWVSSNPGVNIDNIIFP